MGTRQFFTTREVGQILDQPEWLIRRLVDSLSPPVEKFGNKRMVPRDRVPEVREALARHLERREERQAVNHA